MHASYIYIYIYILFFLETCWFCSGLDGWLNMSLELCGLVLDVAVLHSCCGICYLHTALILIQDCTGFVILVLVVRLVLACEQGSSSQFFSWMI